jgi:hypothetical protein
MTSKERIIEKVIDLLKAAPQGIRYSPLVQKVAEALPDIPQNTIHGTIWDIAVQRPDAVYKPTRGHYIHASFKPTSAEPSKPAAPKVKEEQFYKPFAEWLVNELEECTKAIAVGGSVFKDKWGTPDVIGIREPKKSDIVKFPTEIVSAEVKVDSAGLITAFGQACAYRLFSHRSYIVVPVDAPDDDIGRLDTLARIFGIGLILFDPKTPGEPGFEIRVRASKHDPDMFYVNRYLRLIEDDLFT